MSTPKKTPRRPQIAIGDCFEMRLRNESYGYGQYIHYDDTTKREHPPGLRVLPGLGTMVRIFDIRSPQALSVEDLRACREMFPPVFVSLLGAVRRKRWRIIGHLETPSFAYPRFRHTFNTKPGKHVDWSIVDETTITPIGALTPKDAELEVFLSWGDEILEMRLNGEPTYVQALL